MADTPLKKYIKLADKFGVSDAKNVPLEQRLIFAREQATQMKQITNRLLFDLTTSHLHYETAKDDATKSAYITNINKYETDLRQTVAALDIVLALVAELETAVEAQD